MFFSVVQAPSKAGCPEEQGLQSKEFHSISQTKK